MESIKKITIQIMFVTGLVLVILAVFSAFSNIEITFFPTVIEIFAANIVIVLGCNLRWKFEIPYILVEYLVDIGYTIVVLIIFGLMFNWYYYISVWHLILMAAAIYIFSIMFIFANIKKNAEEMNKLLEKHKEKNR